MMVAALISFLMVMAHGGCYLIHDKARASNSNSVWLTRAQSLVALLGFLAPVAAFVCCDVSAAVVGAFVPPLVVGTIKQASFNFVASTYRALAAEGTLAGHLEALSSRVGFSVGDITASSYLYYMAAPTLVYQTAYPRAPTNWGRVARLGVEMALIGALCSAISLGALLSHLQGNVHHLAGMDLRWGSFAFHGQTHLVIALLNTITWAVGVGYGVFHAGLNLLAEVTGFGDQRFYGRWWTARNFRQFWCVVHALGH
jgi:hypothetical protein